MHGGQTDGRPKEADWQAGTRAIPGTTLELDLAGMDRDRPGTAPGRSLRRSEHEELVEAHRARMATAEAKALYKLRSQTVE
jgi:hypothetical protein